MQQIYLFIFFWGGGAVEKLVLQTSENHFFFYAFGTDLGFGATHPHPNAMSQNCSHNISMQM